MVRMRKLMGWCEKRESAQRYMLDCAIPTDIINQVRSNISCFRRHLSEQWGRSGEVSNEHYPVAKFVGSK